MNSPHHTSFPPPIGLILQRPVLNSPFWKVLSCPGLTPTSSFSGMTVTGVGVQNQWGALNILWGKEGLEIQIGTKLGLCVFGARKSRLWDHDPSCKVKGTRMESSISIVTIIRVRLRSLKKINPSFLAKEQFAAFGAHWGAQTRLDGTALSLVGSFLIPRRISIRYRDNELKAKLFLFVCSFWSCVVLESHLCAFSYFKGLKHLVRHRKIERLCDSDFKWMN